MHHPHTIGTKPTSSGLFMLVSPLNETKRRLSKEKRLSTYNMLYTTRALDYCLRIYVRYQSPNTYSTQILRE